MTPLILTLTIAAGGAGALLRYVLHALPQRHHPDGRARGITAPWRILIINVVASFIAGVAIALLPAVWEPVAIAGFCGGLSTWSAFMVDTHAMWRSGRRMRAVALVAAHVGYGLLAAIAGLLVGQLL